MLPAAKSLGSLCCFAASLAALVGCATAAEPLDGTPWKLTGWTLSSLSPADFVITASFEAGHVSGSSAVNRYSGSCQLGPGDAIAVGSLASTRMAGSGPAMQAESGYLKLLLSAKSYRRTDSTLVLYDESGNESLRFAAEEP